MSLKPYHHAWLSIHPHRTECWLRERLREGFDIHHIDGNHENNDALNLALVEHTDHLRVHNRGGLGRILATETLSRRTSLRRSIAEQARSLIVEGMGHRELERRLGYCATTIHAWVRAFPPDGIPD